MPVSQQSRGSCAYCEKESTKGAISKHLSACPKRKAIIEQAERQRSATEILYHLRIQAAGSAPFWLDIEARGPAKLADLDYYLRSIWLECCDHMSEFWISGRRGDEISMRRQIGMVFNPGVELTHVYDFGTSSETEIKFVSARQGKPTTKHPIALMARNLMPEAKCQECEESAKWLCQECMFEDSVEGTLCDEHAETHPHDDYGEPMPIVNSPRMGMCGYSGPAIEPY